MPYAKTAPRILAHYVKHGKSVTIIIKEMMKEVKFKLRKRPANSHAAS